ncbi:MAG: hypothetical protein FWG82_05995, partial [Oscillospiraceae bacterium]|nr:hypothetical protein [Oscillospiraceae bacterium]
LIEAKMFHCAVYRFRFQQETLGVVGLATTENQNKKPRVERFNKISVWLSSHPVWKTFISTCISTGVAFVINLLTNNDETPFYFGKWSLVALLISMVSFNAIYEFICQSSSLPKQLSIAKAGKNLFSNMLASYQEIHLEKHKNQARWISENTDAPIVYTDPQSTLVTQLEELSLNVAEYVYGNLDSDNKKPKHFDMFDKDDFQARILYSFDEKKWDQVRTQGRGIDDLEKLAGSHSPLRKMLNEEEDSLFASKASLAKIGYYHREGTPKGHVLHYKLHLDANIAKHITAIIRLSSKKYDMDSEEGIYTIIKYFESAFCVEMTNLYIKHKYVPCSR